jgi:hypothetical protein
MTTGVVQVRHLVADWTLEEIMGRQGTRLTAQEERFSRLVALEQKSYVTAFREAYPPRQSERSAQAERVSAKRLAKRTLVKLRIAELRTELEASDPVEMRRRANAVLGRILGKQQDPKYRLTAITTLRYLDGLERSAAQETYRAVVAQMKALDAMEGSTTNREHSTSGRSPSKQHPQVDIDQIIADIDQLVAAQRHSRGSEPLPIPVLELRPNDPPKAMSEVTPIKEEPVSQAAVPQASGFKLVRKPGHFGKGGWMRVPSEN